MRYLGLGGESRGFRALFNGGTFYCPEKIAPVDEEILIEKSFSQRLHQFLAPYLDGDMRLHQCLPSISHRVGSVAAAGDKCIVFCPRTHILEFPFRLQAALLETFAPELLQQPLHYFASSPAEAAAFCAAFPVEQKHLYLPEGTPSPEADEFAQFHGLPELAPKDYIALKDKFSGRLGLRMDGLNFFRALGLSALMIHAVFLAGEQKLWFYGDQFNLAVPADNMETLLAAYILARGGLPIRKIFALSSHNRMAYNFLSKGGFSPSMPCDAAFYASISRFLYEISKGSMPKVVGWQENLRQKGSFMVDSGTQGLIHKKIEAHFTSPGLLQSAPPQPLSKTAHAAYALAQGHQIPTLVLDESVEVPLSSQAPRPVSADEIFTRLHKEGNPG